MALTKEEVQQIVQQAAQQTAAEIGQQQAKQIEQAVSQGIQAEKQGVQGSQQDKNTYSENKFEETYVGEAFQSKGLNDSEMWSLNKKLVTEREQKAAQNSQDFDVAHKAIELAEAKLELARKQHDFGIKQQLDHLTIISHTNANIFNKAIDMEYAKFNAAVSEPLAPNTKDSGSKIDASAKKLA